MSHLTQNQYLRPAELLLSSPRKEELYESFSQILFNLLCAGARKKLDFTRNFLQKSEFFFNFMHIVEIMLKT